MAFIANPLLVARPKDNVTGMTEAFYLHLCLCSGVDIWCLLSE